MAVTQQVILTTTVVAVDIILQQHFVGFDGKVCAAGKAVLGVAETDANAEDAVGVNVLGIIAVEAGAAIEAGASVQSDAEGCAIAKTGSNAVAGIALDAATQAGDTVRILRGA
ncbi:DUF2190 family protein [Escherichia coli]|uniref:capsid cement protein n=1 Tax=Escherichia coli TaxID=562 RepID=UPI0003EF3277|nr:capsid cement protein [Escherichia coli]DAU86914.1 MAG TPA: capsid fiber protein [Caudoviricetes sp.]EEQ6524690.1 DUF2190 family protein [Escherichia coli]EEQ9687443.1 DUF2190 family protein [Escherichia coli]EEQ9771942.1 DUF2190 family protein [Escherichia coli]EFA9668220.1 DUF2190 family protein [Escherichia coli]